MLALSEKIKGGGCRPDGIVRSVWVYAELGEVQPKGLWIGCEAVWVQLAGLGSGAFSGAGAAGAQLTWQGAHWSRRSSACRRSSRLMRQGLGQGCRQAGAWTWRCTTGLGHGAGSRLNRGRTGWAGHGAALGLGHGAGQGWAQGCGQGRHGSCRRQNRLDKDSRGRHHVGRQAQLGAQEVGAGLASA